MHTYHPGQGVRFKAALTIDTVPTDASALSCVVTDPAGNTTTDAAPAHDGTGGYHSDFKVPTTGLRGTWESQWFATGGAVAQNGVSDPLPFTVR